ncbi:MAG: ABC transporter ATP-binding protein [Candidatus Lokiarchaeota archaeon]|nr:ABC transporter ATP-binding protein [Candidatus Lokiarchaeota archaeon]
MLDNVDYCYPNGTKALKNISLNIHKGEFIAIMGQNGAGKTTLIRLLNGLLKPTKGDIYFENENINTKTVATLSKKIGIIFQNPTHQLFSNTVEDEILFSLKSLGLDKSEMKIKAEKVINQFNFVNYRNRSPLNLSGGEAKRLAIASIICRDPEVIIFDEPTLGQDEEGIKFFINLINQELDKGTTLIIVTHNIEFTIDFIPRTILMVNGKIVADGPTKDVLINEMLIDKSSLILPQIHQFKIELKKIGITIPDNVFHESELIEFLSNLLQNNSNKK